MRLLITLLLAISLLPARAQRACGSTEYQQARIAADPATAGGMAAADAFLARRAATGRVEANDVIIIPVVVHVLYSKASENISNEQIASQIDALNRDFRRRNADSTATPERFRALAADVAIQFQLATATPEGYPTTGIVRKASGTTQWRQDDAMKFASSGGDAAWDSRQYLNLWVCPMGRLLGYASLPGGAGDRDGVVINTSAFGTLGTAAPYHMGRTAVHEVAHWLGLRHIWGDTYCGDDNVDDTPKQSTYSTGCPSGFRTSCNNGATGDMYMNYMDYTNDACMNLFTQGQKGRMRANFAAGGPRVSLLSSKGLNKPWAMPPPTPVEDPKSAPEFSVLTVYPNPAQSVLTVDFGNTAFNGKEVRLYNMQGALVKIQSITGRAAKVNVSNIASGVYWIVCSNGDEVVRKSFVKQ